MADDLRDFNTHLGRLGGGFAEAEAGFIKALESLAAITRERGTLDEQFREMRDTIERLEKLVLERSRELATQREEIVALRREMHDLREQLGHV